MLGFRIVPNDSRKYIRELLKEIWETPGRTVITKAVYTDNPRVDTAVVSKTFSEFYPDKTIYILQV